jgi:hypothetical protein
VPLGEGLDAATQVIVRERTPEVRGRQETFGASARPWGVGNFYKAEGKELQRPGLSRLVQVKPIVECLEADAEDLGRFALVSGAVLEGREDVLALCFA